MTYHPLDKKCRDQELTRFVATRLNELQQITNTPVTELARIAGYQRTCMHRILIAGSTCRMEALYRLAAHFGVSLAYFFPPTDKVGDLDIDLARTVKLHEAAPMTKKAIEQINKLNVAHKQLLLSMLSSTDDLPVVLRVISLLVKASPARQKKILAALEGVLNTPEIAGS